ncbi:MAG: divergent PAP2 family protein [Oscillospiraceae bacterium]|jgi:acid phosphatase family membrane protein YuiD|nr:divergent PAP2 family protein [Oscillospiraceae bacterium]
MRAAVNFLTGNHIINVALITFTVAQVLKVVILLIVYKKLDFRRLLGSGGMPSSHSATVCAMAASVGKLYGMESGHFAIAAITAAVVMFDASNVRRAAGEQAKILNFIMGNWGHQKPEFVAKELKELLGHTPFEVFVGAALGIALGVIL